ncbi:hypothetical protein MK489_18820 [Myxococcota bacterium]|nr:hypothetical protein [Myxococcota bacterium]
MRVLMGVLLGAAFLGALLYFTLEETRVECEVCVRFEGKLDCRIASGADERAAIRGGIANACGLLARGVTEAIACDRTEPESVRCGFEP